MHMEQGVYCAICIAPNTESLFSVKICKQLKSLQVVNCKIKVVYVDIQTVLDRLSIYPLVAYLYLQSIFVKNYESWLALDIVIAIITAYFFLGHTAYLFRSLLTLRNNIANLFRGTL